MSGDRRYLEDLSVEGMLNAVLLRAPIARGRLLGIDVPHLPSSCTLIRALDIPGTNRLEAFGTEMPILASNEISYQGEPLAILVGPDKGALERLAASCTVRVKEEKPRLTFEKFSSDQLAGKRMATIGDPAGAFSHAAHIIEGVYRTGRQEHWNAESTGALAQFHYDKLLVSVATQWPFHVRKCISAVLDVVDDDIVIAPTEVGVHLDGKLWFPSLVACQAALAAVLCKKPVKLLFSRQEEAQFSPKRPPVLIRQRAAIDKEGNLLALEAKTTVDIGASGPFADEILDRLCLGSLGSYRCPNVRLEGYAVRTNTVPAGPFAGFGLSQGFFSIERHIAKVAQAAGMEGVEWRKHHAPGKGERLASGSLVKDPVPAASLIDTVMAMSDYRRKWASYELLHHAHPEERAPRDEKLRGIGLSFAYQGNDFLSSADDKGTYSVELTLEKDGKLEIRTSAVSGSRETAVLWRQTAAEILNIDEGEIRVAENHSDSVPDSGPSTLSRNITNITRLIERCCQAIRKQRFRDPLPITVKRSYRVPKNTLWNGAQTENSPFSLVSWAAAVVETEIDPVDYTVQVRGVWLAVDGGKILNERRARTSLKAGTLHALDWARKESLELENGGFSPEAVLSYDFSPPSETPEIKIDFSWTDAASPKGIGELPFACLPAAYAHALSQATGTSFDTIPITASKIRDALEGR